MWRGRSDKNDGQSGYVEDPTEGRGGGAPDYSDASPEELRNDIRSGKIRRVGGSEAEATFSPPSMPPFGDTGTSDFGGFNDAAPGPPTGYAPPARNEIRPPAVDPGAPYRHGPEPDVSERTVPMAAVDGTGQEPPPRSDQQPRDLGVFTNVANQNDESDPYGPKAGAGSLRPVGPDGPYSAEEERFEGPSHSDDEPRRSRPPHPADSGYGPMPARSGLRAVDSPPQANPDPWASGDDSWSSSWSDRDTGQDDGSRPQPPKLELAPPVEPRPGRGPLLALGALALLLGLGALYYFVIRDADSPAEDGTVAADDAQNAESTDASGDDSAGQETAAEGDDPAVIEDDSAEPTSLNANPVLSLEGADSGPLETETAYPTQLEGAPVDSEYIVIVDGREQGEPIDYLPDLVLPEGRHSIVMEVMYQGETATTNPVEVYVLAPELAASYRANLSSVSVQDEGWGEAMRQFDEFRAAGHEQLKLSPSDPYPSLLPGYWNIYVDGFGSREESAAYCESSGLSIPDQCFPSPFDPDAPARGD